MFRNPLYLNEPLLRSLADYYGVELLGDREVTRRRRDESRRRAGVNKYIEVGREGGKEDEVTETYSMEFRPVRALNDVVDRLLQDEALVDLTLDEEQGVAQRSTVQVEGLLELSPVTEVGALMSALLPPMIEQLAAGEESPELDPALLGQVFLGGPPQGVLHVFTVEVGVHRFLIMADPKHLYGNATMDDLDGELTILASVDRMIPEGTSKPLDRYVMPNMNRATRRLFGRKDFAEMIEGLGDVLGQRVDRSALTVEGPAIIATPVAIY